MEGVCQGCKEQLFRIEILREEKRTVAGRAAVYRLCVCCFSVPQYAVEVIFGEERSAAYLGEDKKASAGLFELLVCGEVTPCTLRDIVEDLRHA